MSHEDHLNQRYPITFQNVDTGMEDMRGEWCKRLNKKGFGIFISTHEILGVVNEEHYELIEAVKKNDQANIREELVDLCVACLHGIASIDTKKMDW